jgi:hypothetical protein
MRGRPREPGDVEETALARGRQLLGPPIERLRNAVSWRLALSGFLELVPLIDVEGRAVLDLGLAARVPATARAPARRCRRDRR